MAVERPTELLKNIMVKEKIVMTAGVSNLSHRIRNSMGLPLLSPTDYLFERILRDITEGIRYLFQTKNRFSFAINGPTSLAYEMALSNLLVPKDDTKVMVVVHGVQGERIAKSTKGMGFKLLRLQTNLGELVDMETFKSAFQKHKPKVLFLCHGDDSVGTLQPLRGIGSLCHENNCLFIVDGSATVGCLPLNADSQEIDILFASTEYGLGLSSGLTLISFSNRAVDLIKATKNQKICFTMNFDNLIESLGLSEDTPKVYGYYSPPISLLYALREALAMVVEEGLDKMIARHMKCSLQAQNEITKIGLKYLVTEENKRLTFVLVIVVSGAVRRDVIVDYMSKYYDIVISNGLSPIDKVWRIGILGQNANRSTVKLMTVVLREAIEKAKKTTEQKSSLSSPSTIGW